MDEHSTGAIGRREAIKTGTSRRTALKLGAGAGVGMVAWSGMSITSLGGTPAYASGCTFAVRVTLLSCRNTTQQTGSQFSYQPLDLSGLPAGYTFDQNVPNNNLCESNDTSTLTFPPNITCTVTIRFREPPKCTGTFIGEIVYASSTGTLLVTWACLPPETVFTSQTQFQIDLECNTTDGPQDCFN